MPKFTDMSGKDINLFFNDMNPFFSLCVFAAAAALEKMKEFYSVHNQCSID